MSETEEDRYDTLFSRFIRDLHDVAFLKPRSKYLYPVMKGVPFQDFHVSLQMIVQANKKQVNDNRKEMEALRRAFVMEEAAEIAHQEILEGKKFRKKPGPKPKTKTK